MSADLPGIGLPTGVAGPIRGESASGSASMGLAERVVGLLATTAGEIVIEPPGDGDGYWAGGPSIVHDEGVFWLAYRLRRPVDQGRGYANVIARSDDGVHFETVSTVTAARFACASLERPALIRRPDGGWRVYISCSTPGSKHWWVEALDAATPDGLADGERHLILPGDGAQAWKDVVVHRRFDTWSMWACRHPLDGGDDEADRMVTCFLSSDDGLRWSTPRPALAPDGAGWDSRGRRLTSVVAGTPWTAFYDGRASAAENFRERTAGAEGAGPEAFIPVTGPTPPGRTLRYLSIAPLPGGYRLYWEASRDDGSNDLRTAFLPAAHDL